MSTNESSPIERKQIINYYENKIQALKKILEQTEELNSSLIQDNDALQKEILSLKRKAQSLYITAEKIKGQEQTASKINDLLLEQKSAVQEDRANIKRENYQLRSKIKALQEQLAAQEDTLSKSTALERSLKDVKLELAGKEAEINDLVKMLMQFERENEALLMKIEEMEREREMDVEMNHKAESGKDIKTGTVDKSFEEEPQVAELVGEVVSIKAELDFCRAHPWVTDVSMQTEQCFRSVSTQTTTSATDFREGFNAAPLHVSSSTFQIVPEESAWTVSEISLFGEDVLFNLSETSSDVMDAVCEREPFCNSIAGSSLPPVGSAGSSKSSLYVPPGINNRRVASLKSYKSETRLEIFSTRDTAVQTDLPHETTPQPPRPRLPLVITSNGSCLPKRCVSTITLPPTPQHESLTTRTPDVAMVLLRVLSIVLPVSVLLLYVGYHTAADFFLPSNQNSFSKYEVISTIIKEVIQRRMYLYYPYGPPPT